MTSTLSTPPIVQYKPVVTHVEQNQQVVTFADRVFAEVQDDINNRAQDIAKKILENIPRTVKRHVFEIPWLEWIQIGLSDEVSKNLLVIQAIGRHLKLNGFIVKIVVEEPAIFIKNQLCSG